jgi:hypothetical protein
MLLRCSYINIGKRLRGINNKLENNTMKYRERMLIQKEYPFLLLIFHALVTTHLGCGLSHQHYRSWCCWSTCRGFTRRWFTRRWSNRRWPPRWMSRWNGNGSSIMC